MRLEPQVISLIQLYCNVAGHTEWRHVTQNHAHVSALVQARSCAFGLLLVWQNTVSLKHWKICCERYQPLPLVEFSVKWAICHGGGLTIQGVNVQLNKTAFSWTLLFHWSCFTGIFSIKTNATFWSQTLLCSIILLLFILFILISVVGNRRYISLLHFFSYSDYCQIFVSSLRVKHTFSSPPTSVCALILS